MAIRINLLPNWRQDSRNFEMTKELCLYSFIFLGMTLTFVGMVLFRVF